MHRLAESFFLFCSVFGILAFCSVRSTRVFFGLQFLGFTSLFFFSCQRNFEGLISIGFYYHLVMWLTSFVMLPVVLDLTVLDARIRQGEGGCPGWKLGWYFGIVPDLFTSADVPLWDFLQMSALGSGAMY